MGVSAPPDLQTRKGERDLGLPLLCIPCRAWRKQEGNQDYFEERQSFFEAVRPPPLAPLELPSVYVRHGHNTWTGDGNFAADAQLQLEPPDWVRDMRLVRALQSAQCDMDKRGECSVPERHLPTSYNRQSFHNTSSTCVLWLAIMCLCATPWRCPPLEY